jgi:DNA-binding beta-propeller fold protein YncE
MDVAYDNQTGMIYVSDYEYHAIRRLTAFGSVTTLVGGHIESKLSIGLDTDGTLGIAKFHHPRGLALDAQGDLYVADEGNYRVRKISIDGNVSTVAGSTSGYIVDMGTHTKFGIVFDLVLDSFSRLLLDQ